MLLHCALAAHSLGPGMYQLHLVPTLKTRSLRATYSIILATCCILPVAHTSLLVLPVLQDRHAAGAAIDPRAAAAQQQRQGFVKQEEDTNIWARAAAAAAAGVAAASAAPAKPATRRHSVVDLCGSQVCTYEEEAALRELFTMYVDGSCRFTPWPEHLRMAAGGWCSKANFLCFCRLLLGGDPDSFRSELGAIFVGCQLLLDALEAGKIDPATCEVHMLTDCQGAVRALKRQNAKLLPKHRHLITGRSGPR